MGKTEEKKERVLKKVNVKRASETIIVRSPYNSGLLRFHTSSIIAAGKNRHCAGVAHHDSIAHQNAITH